MAVDVKAEECEAVVRTAVVGVVCVVCGSEYVVQLPDERAPQKPGDFAEMHVRCEGCSSPALEQYIPIVILSGSQVTIVDDLHMLLKYLTEHNPAVLQSFGQYRAKLEEDAEATPTPTPPTTEAPTSGAA